MSYDIIRSQKENLFVDLVPKRCPEVEEIGEELVWRIQELAWEAA